MEKGLFGKSSTRKFFISQLHEAVSIRNAPPRKYVYRQRKFVRAWVQGVVVAKSSPQDISIDDGTGMINIDLQTFCRNVPSDQPFEINIGDYVMVIGPLVGDGVTTRRYINAHQLIELNKKLNREPMWFLEVVESWNLT